MRCFNRYLLTLLALMCLSSLTHASVVVIVHSSNSLTFTEAQLRNIYLGKVKTFDNGNVIKPLDLKPGDTNRAVFLSQLLHKSESNLNSYWSRMLFSSKGQPPQEVSDSAAAVNRVSEDVSAIAYVNEAAVDNSVRVVFRIP